MSATSPIELTPAELKTLKYFALYCQSYGSTSVYRTYYITNCEIDDWSDDQWFSNDMGRPVDSYDRVDAVIDNIIKNNDLTEILEDCDNRGSIRINIECKERILTIDGWEVSYGSEPHGSDYDLDEISEKYDDETYQQVEELFQKLEEMGEEAVINFSGGGDDGEVDDYMVINNESFPIPNRINDMIYDMLNDHPGWENNEGSQGGWTFRPDQKTIEFDFNYNTENEEFIDSDILDFTIEF